MVHTEQAERTGVEAPTCDLGLIPHRSLDPVLFDRVVNRLVTKEGLEPTTAAKATSDAFAFVQLVAATDDSERSFTPTKLVDQAWHATILFTKGYAALCRTVGRFVHHEPHDHPVTGPAATAAVLNTIEAFEAAGIPVNDDLWSFALEVDSGSNCCAAGGQCGGCWS